MVCFPHWVQIPKPAGAPKVYGKPLEMSKAVVFNRAADKHMWVNIGETDWQNCSALPLEGLKAERRASVCVNRNAMSVFRRLLAFDAGPSDPAAMTMYPRTDFGRHLELTYDESGVLTSKKLFQVPYQGRSVFFDCGAALGFSLTPVDERTTIVHLALQNLEVERVLEHDCSGATFCEHYCTEMERRFPSVVDYFAAVRASE